MLEVSQIVQRVVLPLQINRAFQAKQLKIQLFVLEISHQALGSLCAASVTCRKVRFQNWQDVARNSGFPGQLVSGEEGLQSCKAILVYWPWISNTDKEDQKLEAMVKIPRSQHKFRCSKNMLGGNHKGNG